MLHCYPKQLLIFCALLNFWEFLSLIITHAETFFSFECFEVITLNSKKNSIAIMDEKQQSNESEYIDIDSNTNSIEV